MIHGLRLRNLHLTAVRLERQVAERTLELKAAKESAEVAKEAAESANRAKSTFLSHMSHELRTPLNAILGFARLLREDGLSQKQRADVDTISRGGEHLLGLINDVLDMAKIEAGRTAAEIAPCDLERLVLDVISMMGARATEKNPVGLCPTDRRQLRRRDITRSGINIYDAAAEWGPCEYDAMHNFVANAL